MLGVEDLSISFGGLAALSGLSFEVRDREIFALIGPNGAGKSTVFNVITGVYTPTSGSIVFEGNPIAGERCGRITRRGVARTFQNIRLFGEMSVLDNVKVAFDCRQATTLTTAVLRTPSHREEEARIDRESRDLLKIFKLGDLADERAKNLPYGSQRRLDVCEWPRPVGKARPHRLQRLVRRAGGIHHRVEIRRVEMTGDKPERVERLQQRGQHRHDVVHHGLAHRGLAFGCVGCPARGHAQTTSHSHGSSSVSQYK